MAAHLLQTQFEVQPENFPLLMERQTSHAHEHAINIAGGVVASMPSSRGDDQSDLDGLHFGERPSTSTQSPISGSTSASPTTLIPESASLIDRTDGNRRRRRSPLNSGLWITTELVVNALQIIAAITVLSLSRYEHPQDPLFLWVIGYTAGCFANFLYLYWRYIHRTEQDPVHSHQGSSPNNNLESPRHDGTTFYEGLEGEHRRTDTVSRSGTVIRLHALVDYFKIALDCFFAVWFVVGNVWIFGGHSANTSSPSLYWLSVVFLIFSCIGYAMPFILCATVCCCLPCVISILGFGENMGQSGGATAESIDALPTYKFNSTRNRHKDKSDINRESPSDGWILAAGTDKERIISAEDAVCCICLSKYVDEDELRELLCAHLFHKGCVDKWLKINALCPLCKSRIGDTVGSAVAAASSSSHNDPRAGSGENALRIPV